jgi:chromosome segregation ATPase
MASSTPMKNFGPLTKAALTLEEDFQEIDRLNVALAKFRDGTETNLERAQKLLSNFGQVGQRVGERIQDLSKVLNESRLRAEAATQGISESASFLRTKLEQSASISDRFRHLVKRMQEMSSSLAELGRNAGTAEEKKAIAAHLPELEQQIASLADETLKVKDEARVAKLKDLEREAESMAHNLQATQKKIQSLTKSKSI